MLALLKNTYWQYNRKAERQKRLRLTENSTFAERLYTEQKEVLFRASKPSCYSQEEHLEQAIQWILRAQKATEDHGVSLGYFPVTLNAGWVSSYPETTGYIITTLLSYAKSYNRPEIKVAALKMADWEIEIQMVNGAVQGGPVCPAEQQTAAAFNTGMVIDGWISCYEHTRESKFLDAAILAATFLANDINEDGFFKTNGEFVVADRIKTYTCLCAWAIYRTGIAAKDNRLISAAITSIEAALSLQNQNGWFEHNCLTHSDMPLTHTLGYVLQGIFEVGVLANRKDFIEAVKKALTGVVPQVQENGFLSARLDYKWKSKKKFACLTGSVQLAILCFRMAEEVEDDQFVETGHRLTNFVKATQLIESKNLSMQGAIAGSFPISGEYMSYGYPNWATKYFIDSLVLQQKFL